MYFEAKMRDQSYKLEVFETETHWRVSIEEQGKAKEQHNIPKADYQRMDDAVCFLFNNNSYMVDVVGAGTKYSVYTRGSFREITLFNDELLLHESLKGGGVLGSASQIAAGMPGKIVKVIVKKGDKVSANQVMIVMEAMKMENDIKAPHEVTVKEVKVKEGDSVESGAVLVIFEK